MIRKFPKQPDGKLLRAFTCMLFLTLFLSFLSTKESKRKKRLSKLYRKLKKKREFLRKDKSQFFNK